MQLLSNIALVFSIVWAVWKVRDKIDDFKKANTESLEGVKLSFQQSMNKLHLKINGNTKMIKSHLEEHKQGG
jgi:hypothetical protein